MGYGYDAAANRGSNAVLDVVSHYLWRALFTLPPSRLHVACYDIRPLAKPHPDWCRQDLMTLLDLLSAGKRYPVIMERLSLEEVVCAHREVERAEVEGKVVLMPKP
ncbi:MAG: zinc-binding dehydrogenase [Nitrososphaerota archaeon]